MKIYSNNLDRIGNTPMVRISYEDLKNVDLYMKLEGENPTGSIKDRTALGIIKKEISEGRLSKGKTILDASSGSYACALSYIGKILDFPVKVVSGSKLTQDKRNFINYFGAELISYGDYTIEGNHYCRELYHKNPDKYCFLDQLHNWQNPNVHFGTTGPEILKVMPDVEAIIFSLGSGGTLSGVAKYFKENKPNIKLIAITAASGTKIPGTGSFIDGDYVTPFIQDLYDLNYLDYIAEIDINSAIDGVKFIQNQGFYVGIQTGAVFQGMLQGVLNLGISGKVVMISGDAGWKNSDKLLNLNSLYSGEHISRKI